MHSYLRTLRGQMCFCAKQPFPNTYRPLIFIPGKNVVNKRYQGSHRKLKHKKDLYEVLELSSKATSVQIKGAYFRLSKKYHPDVNKNENAVAKFAEIAEAYEILGKPHSRRLYDKGLEQEDELGNTKHPDGWKAYRKGFKKYDGPPVRGRTSIYDFDTWTKTHYAEVFEKRAAEKKKFDEYEIGRQMHRQSRSTAHIKEENKLAFYLIMGFMFIVYAAGGITFQDIAVSQANESNILQRKAREKREKDQRLAIKGNLETNLATD
ncbi:dnaJ homolog subfamily C member 30, mitochondrial-like [Ylistrum balloti]|uniref:dnaJ homolog subfamily C member 30, mitochondrial-like n=1 Tax=Ylistrum balloti TaxID=509963 RepID=UPI002905EEB8|nr:dnaJ homolog subfamily C member 30, mitochondrial-like [Ylistrum balloti]